MKMKVHIRKPDTERTTLCSYTGVDLNFATENDRPNCKKCIKIRDHGRHANGNEPLHQSALRRRMRLGDKSIFECQCGGLYSSIDKLMDHPKAPKACAKCRKLAEEMH